MLIAIALSETLRLPVLHRHHPLPPLQLATVPYYEWLPLGADDGRKMAYLRNMLGIPAVPMA